jgi:hypothetical protein
VAGVAGEAGEAVVAAAAAAVEGETEREREKEIDHEPSARLGRSSVAGHVTLDARTE